MEIWYLKNIVHYVIFNPVCYQEAMIYFFGIIYVSKTQIQSNSALCKSIKRPLNWKYIKFKLLINIFINTNITVWGNHLKSFPKHGNDCED